MKSIDLLNHNQNNRQSKLPAEESIKLTEVTKLIAKSKKTVVLTGAGISCNAGIPDFRSTDGLYNMVKAKYPKVCVKGQDLFDISLFRDELTLSLFCTFMEGLYSSSLQATPTETHRFIKHLKEKNKLLRCYTQNIDSLEKTINLNCGVDLSQFEINKNFAKNWKNLDVIQLHGNLHKLSCTQCFQNFEWTPEHKLQLSEGTNPECSNCYLKYQERLYSGKRLTGNIGLLRPDIVLYGENHPQADILAKGLNIDLGLKSDLLIIMGTSLKVDGVKKLVKSLAKAIHDKNGTVIFVNKTPLSKQWNNIVDYEVLSDCDDFVRVLKDEIPDLFLTQEQLDSKKLKNNKLKEEQKQIKLEKSKTKMLSTPPSTPKKNNRIKTEFKKEEIKPASAKLKRETEDPHKINEATQKFKCRLPSPLSSFNENDDATPIKQEIDNDDVMVTSSTTFSAAASSSGRCSRPLRPLTRSQLNQERTGKRRIKQESSVDEDTKRIKV